MKNNYKKSAALVELVWKMSKEDKFAHGFSDKRNFYALVSVCGMTGSLLLLPYSIKWMGGFIFALAMFVLTNLPFYRFLLEEKGISFLVRTIFLHYLIYLTVGVGSILGAGRYYLNRLHAKPEH